MDKLKKKLAVKLAAYIFMIVCTVLLVFSSIIACVNIAGEWYSVGELAVKNDIYSRTAEEAQAQLIDSIESLYYYEGISDDTYYDDEMESDMAAEEDISSEEDMDEFESQIKDYIDVLKQMDEDEELLKGEALAGGFGYSIYKYDLSSEGGKSLNRKNPVRQVNTELAEKEGSFTMGLNHDFFRIDVYLGNLSTQALPDYVSPVYKYLNFAYYSRYAAIIVAVMSFFAALFLMLFLLVSIGQNNRESNEKRNIAIKAIPLDLTAFVLAMACIIFVSGGGAAEIAGYVTYNFDLLVAAVTVGAIVAAVLFSGYILLFAARVKLGRWWHSTIIYQCIRLIRRVLDTIYGMLAMIPLVWRTSLILAGCLIMNVLLTILISEAMWFGSSAVGVILWFIPAVLVSYAVLKLAVGLRKLKEGGKHLADGDLEYHIDDRGLWFDLKEHAENLNSIGKGMETAVAAKMQSERFKNELITNVSHDLKTPLTSIINYVDLLKKEKPESEKIKEYIDVLDRQSQRLKKLTEDVVEASKVATGNVNLEMAPCQVGVLMTQIMGEYGEKAKENDLVFIIDIPKEDVNIMADGRSMWRVLNNLLSNICKYSMPGTRVYQYLEVSENKAIITYKNISKYELNISGQELTERFIRGDSSRHTEGSGLGLSIAQNLVELQNGSFDIQIDGDLFKVVMEFELLGS